MMTVPLLFGCQQKDNFFPPVALEASSPASTVSEPAKLSERNNLALPNAITAHPMGADLIVHGDENAAISGGPSMSSTALLPPGTYVLNFDNADIRDVVKSVLGDMLTLNYSVEPSVQGSISLHTARPLPREAVLPAFESALRLAGAALVQSGSAYAVVPLQEAARRGPIGFSGGGLKSGFQVNIVPLRYVTAAEVQHVIEPLVGSGTVVQVEPQRNLLMVAGTSEEIARAGDVINLFDVDWLRNQSFGLFPLRYSAAKDVADDLGNLVGKQASLGAMVRIVPIEHLNAILVVSPHLSHVNEMRAWVARFDRGRDATKPRLFIYRVQNGRARDLASTLSRVLSAQGGDADPRGSTDATDAAATPASLTGAGSMTPRPTSGLGLPQAAIPNALLGGLPGDRAGTGTGDPALRITADESNNALLIITTPDRYADLEAALAQLDRVPQQVLLEASIAEVTLTKQLQYGVQYSFQQGHLAVLGSNVATAALAPATGGLSVAYLQGSNIQAVLSLLSSLTTVKVVSAPKVLVMNNRTASLQVGDSVPVATASAVSTIASNAPVVNSIQMVDTGVILHVTPRVNASGLVILDLSQEVSASTPTTSSNIDSPTIQQRRVSTSVAVQDGATIAIGGLISDNRTRSHGGIPVLKDIPGLGVLFGQTNNQATRTELIILITPHVIRDQQAANAATDELRGKLPLIRDFNERRTR